MVSGSESADPLTLEYAATQVIAMIPLSKRRKNIELKGRGFTKVLGRDEILLWSLFRDDLESNLKWFKKEFPGIQEGQIHEEPRQEGPTLYQVKIEIADFPQKAEHWLQENYFNRDSSRD
jgi:hypothetical protein